MALRKCRKGRLSVLRQASAGSLCVLKFRNFSDHYAEIFRSSLQICDVLWAQDRIAQDNARPHRENRCLGETDAERASELLRILGEPPEPVVVHQQAEAALPRIAQAAQPNGTPQPGEVHPV